MVGILRVGRLLAGTALGSGAAWTPLSLFAANEQGVWYDPSDLSTMYQDAAGTTPVTAVEQPVGLRLDKSKGLVLGQATSATGWTNASWDTFSSTGGSFTASKDVGGGTDAAYSSNTVSITLGVWYEITLTVSATTLSAYTVNLSSTNNARSTVASFSGTGVKKGYVLANVASGNFSLSVSTTAVGSITIDNISVRELPGNHAFQSTAASRPVLSATNRIDFDGTDDKMTTATSGAGTTGFLFVAGLNLDVVGATQTIWSDTGTNTGYRVRINSSNQLELAAGNGSAYTTAATTETLSATTNYVIAAWHDGTNLNVKLGTGGAVASQAFATASAGSASFTMGMDNGAVSSQLNGKIYNAVYVKNFAGSLTDVNNTISYVNGTLT